MVENNLDQRAAVVYQNTKDRATFSIWNNTYSMALNRLYGGDATIATTWGQDGNSTDDSAWYFNKVISAWDATLGFDAYDQSVPVDDVISFDPVVQQGGSTTENYTILWNSSDESIATVNDGEVTATKAGNVTITATLVAVNGKAVENQITVQLPLTFVGMEAFEISAAQASVTQYSSNRAASGAYLNITYTDGTTKSVPVTVGMLSSMNGQPVDTSVPGAYTNLVVTYFGIKVYYGFTLYVAPRVFDDYPDYPDEGAVFINKTGTGIDFQSSGIGMIELSATGIPVKKGADVIVMLDTSSSMNIGMTGASETRLQVLTQSLNNLLNSLQSNGEDGEPLDIKVAIADFNGYFTNSDSNYYIDANDTTSVLANPDKYADEVPLVKALLNYSAAAQVYFNHNTGSLANNSQYITENDKILSNVDLSQYAYTESGSQTGVQFYGANLSLESETAIKLYFVIEGDANALEMTVNGQAVTDVKNGNYYEIKISDIPAHKLGQMYEIKVGGLTLNYGVFSYGFKAMNTTNENLKNTVKALYAYYQAAVA